jgi:hypothetical protein
VAAFHCNQQLGPTILLNEFFADHIEVVRWVPAPAGPFNLTTRFYGPETQSWMAHTAYRLFTEFNKSLM